MVSERIAYEKFLLLFPAGPVSVLPWAGNLNPDCGFLLRVQQIIRLSQLPSKFHLGHPVALPPPRIRLHSGSKNSSRES